MPARSYTQENQYRYGFQNQETDPELWDGSVSYRYRIEDPRLGRFFSVDPLTKKFPHNSCYAFSENRVIDGIELEGLEFMPFAIVPSMNYGQAKLAQKASNGEVAAMKGLESINRANGFIVVAGMTIPFIPIGGSTVGPLLSRGYYYGLNGALWVTNPQNQILMVELFGFTANLFYDGPGQIQTPGSGDELANFVRWTFGAIGKISLATKTGFVDRYMGVALGKTKEGLKDWSNKLGIFDYSTWADGYILDGLSRWEDKFHAVMRQTIDAGGKIFFRLDGVDIDSAKRGFKSLEDAKGADNWTEWELNQILTNKNYKENTIFTIGNQVVPDDKLVEFGIENK